MGALFNVLMIPLIAMNFIGGLVGVVWLLVLGQWSALGTALVLLIGGAFFCGLALLPGLLASGPALMMYDKGGASRIASYPLMLAGLLWTHSVMIVWAFGAFAYFRKLSDSGSLVPMMLIAYLVATAPWSYMAQKDVQSGNESSLASIFFLQASCFIAAVMLGVGDAGLRSSGLMLCVIMGCAFLVNASMAFSRLEHDSIRRRLGL
ncbi:hypothetical protein GCM10028794_24110 [Silanimonas algicola]